MIRHRNISLDILRILACLGVINIHTAGSGAFHHLVEPGTLWYAEYGVLDALTRWSVPSFMMLTGYFFLNPDKEITLKKLFGKYILRIVFTLIFWTVFYWLVNMGNLYPFTEQGHFWYLGMLIGLYMIVPVLRYIATNDSLLRYLCFIWLGFKTYSFIGIFVTLPFTIYDNIFVDSIGYALWAQLIATTNFKQSNLYLIYSCSIICLIIECVIGATVQKPGNLISYESPLTFCVTAGIFTFFLYSSCTNTKQARGGAKIQRIISTISECTLGIYMIHIWVLANVFFRLHRFLPQPLLLVPTSIITTFIISLAITFCIKKIPVLKKWIV